MKSTEEEHQGGKGEEQEEQGGDAHQRIKFYTDLWHVLLGRHKLDDVSGDYPDRTGQEFIIRTLLKTQRENQNFICTTRMLSG